jgi:hypothetical protein
LSYPEPIRLNAIETILGGRCFLCGAHFIVDETGKNVGEAMVQGLQLVAGELGKELTMLADGVDYDDFILRYDAKVHESLGPAPNHPDEHARLYIIRAKKNKAD